MADNSARIAKIKRILESGVKSTTIDGVTVNYDFDELRLQLRRLEAEDPNQTARPIVSSIDLSGAF